MYSILDKCNNTRNLYNRVVHPTKKHNRQMTENIESSSETAAEIPFAKITRFTACQSKKISNTKYDVFINHRGKDVKDTIASLIYHNLRNKKLKVFLDNKEMECGDTIPLKLHQAISTASVHIAIFSKNYAESEWCLSELCLMEKSGAPIIPVFYRVQPSDLRMKGGNADGLYSKAFRELSQKFDSESIEKWKATLHSVSYMCGLIFEGDHGELLEKIADCVMKLIKATRASEVHKVILNRQKRRCLDVDGKGNAIAGPACDTGQSSPVLQISSENVMNVLFNKVVQGIQYKIQEIAGSHGNKTEFEFHTSTSSFHDEGDNKVLPFHFPDSDRSRPPENSPSCPLLVHSRVKNVDHSPIVKDLQGNTVDEEGAVNRVQVQGVCARDVFKDEYHHEEDYT